MVLRTTSNAPLYTPFSAVCMRTLTRSKGWPTMTAQTPPTAPAARERRPDSADLVPSLAVSTSSAWTASGGGASTVEVAIEGVICWLLVLYCRWGRLFCFFGCQCGGGRETLLWGFGRQGHVVRLFSRRHVVQNGWQQALSS